MAKKLTAKQIDKGIEKIFNVYCNRMPIDIMRIGKLFDMARKMVADGSDVPTIGAAMVAFVQADPKVMAKAVP